MKQRTLLCFVALIAVAQSMWAEDVTPEEALWQAQNFMQQRVASGSRPRKAQGVLQLTATQQVSGLYIFNVADDGGFVIVSNDDRTIPVLGFSDNGSIDPDNMPENMKAWLQGYADEIAWLATLNDQTTNSQKRPIQGAATSGNAQYDRYRPHDYDDVAPEHSVQQPVSFGRWREMPDGLCRHRYGTGDELSPMANCRDNRNPRIQMCYLRQDTGRTSRHHFRLGKHD